MEYKNLVPITLSENNLQYEIFSIDLFNMDLTAHDSYEILMVLDGEVRLQTESYDRILTTYNIAMVNSNILHCLEPVNKQAKLLVLQISTDYVHKTYNNQEDVLLFKNDIENTAHQKEFKMLMMHLYIKSHYQEYSQALFILDQMIEILKNYYVNDNHDHIQASLEGIDSTIQRMVLDLSLSHRGEGPLSLAEYAEKYDVNYHYLSRLFKESTGLTYTAFIRNIRLFRATSYLIKSTKNIIDIAYLVGYNDTKSMARDFDRSFQMSPSKFRKHYRTYQKNDAQLIMRMKKVLKTLDIQEVEATLENQTIFYKIDFNHEVRKSKKTHSKTVLDLEQIYYEGITLSESIEQVSTLNIRFVRLHFKMIDGHYQLVKTKDSSEPFSNYQINNLINFAKELNINALLCFHYDNQMSVTTCHQALMDILDEAANRFCLKAIQNWRYELFLDDCHQDADFEVVKKTLNHFRDIIIEYVGERNLFIGLNVGLYRQNDAFNHSLLKKFLPCKLLNFISLDFEESLCNGELGQQCSLSELFTDIHRINPDIKLLLDVTFKLKDRLYALNPYHEALYSLFHLQTYLQAEISYYLVNWRINDGYHTYPSHLINKYGIESVNYYYHTFANSLYEDIVYEQQGITITRDQDNDDYNIIIYSDVRAKTLELTENDFDIESADTIHLQMLNLTGEYRLSEYHIDFKTFYYYYEWLNKFEPSELTIKERRHIKARCLPDFKFHRHTSQLDQNISIHLAPVDVVFLKLEKISK